MIEAGEKVDEAVAAGKPANQLAAIKQSLCSVTTQPTLKRIQLQLVVPPPVHINICVTNTIIFDYLNEIFGEDNQYVTKFYAI